MSDALAVYIFGTMVTFTGAVLVMVSPDQFMGSGYGNPHLVAEWRRPIARVALLCWAWPVLALAAVGYGLRLLWRAAR